MRDTGRRIDVPVAFLTWLAAWLLGQVVALVVYSAGGYEDLDDVPIWVLFVSQLLVWGIFVAGMVLASKREGTGQFRADYQVRARAVDLLGVPIGVLTQLVLVPLVYLPLETLWQDVFTEERLTENAKDLVDRASGGSMVLLVVMVCVGAPLVEELVYRGLLQGSFAARVNHVPAVARRLGAVRPRPLPARRVPGLVRDRPRLRRLCARHRPPRHGDRLPHRLQRDRFAPRPGLTSSGRQSLPLELD